MNRGGKIVVALVIAICGIGAAGMFRSARSTHDSKTDSRFAGLSFRGESSATGQGTNGANFSPFEPTAPQQLDTVRGSTSLPTDQINTDQPPPRLPGGKGSRPPIPGEGNASRSYLDGANWPPLTPRPADAASPLERERRGHQHKIRDGDTLDDLAERYLGDSRRASEIFEANRHVLTDPQILPLGRSIRIPPRRFSPNVRPTTNVLRPKPPKSVIEPEKKTAAESANEKTDLTEEIEPYDPNKPIPLFAPVSRENSTDTKKSRTTAIPAGAKPNSPPASVATPSIQPSTPKSIPSKESHRENRQLVPLPKGALRRAREEAQEKIRDGAAK